MHLSMYCTDGAYPAPSPTIAAGLAHVCTAGNRRGFLSAGVHAFRVVGIWQTRAETSPKAGQAGGVTLPTATPGNPSQLSAKFRLASMPSARCSATLNW